MSEFWVYENWTLRKAVLHRGECGACKRGRGQHGGGETKNGRWHGPYSSADAARADAPIRATSLKRECGLCMVGPGRSPYVGRFRDSSSGTLVEQATHQICPDQA